MKYLPLILIVLSGAAYHTFQKLVGREQNPWVVLAAVYFTAFLCSLVPLIWARTPVTIPSVPATLGLALACVGIELGFMLAYRGGWKMSALSTHTSVCAFIVTASLGLFFFGERIEIRTLLGLALAVFGLILGQPLGR